MISQRCPRCYSRRIRRGYRQTHLLSKLFFRYNLLCDGCNWEFKGFAVPFTVSSTSIKKSSKSKQSLVNSESVKSDAELEEKFSEFYEEKEKEKALGTNSNLEGKETSNQEITST